MAGAFFDSFNAALIDLEAQFTEDWILDGVTYPAIAINDFVGQTIMMKGGNFQEVSVSIFVRDEIITQSGVVEGDVVTVRGQDFAILQITSQGDACKELTCGPAQIDVWGK